MINVAIGQSQLLINKKFQQFRDLISTCEAKDPEAPVTCEDLHGFWDMVYMQVVNLEKRFENLKTLKENNWKEIIPETKVNKKARVIKKKAVKSNSNLKDIIRGKSQGLLMSRNFMQSFLCLAARQLKKQENKEQINSFEAGFFSVSSPVNADVRKTLRRSARKLTVDASVNLNRSKNSPGLQILRASMNIKQITEDVCSATKTSKKQNLSMFFFYHFRKLHQEVS